MNNKGFTLLELSIVLVVIALVTAMAVSSGINVVATARLTSTQKKMKAIDDALMQFRAVNDRLPCPGAFSLTPGSANYGLEAGAGTGSAIAVGTGVCTGVGMLPQATSTAAGANNTSATGAEGTLPAVTLGLPIDFMVDGWGNEIRYAVDISYTAAGAFASTPVGCTNGAITVNDASGNARSTGSVYALISHGANGHGAYTSNGVVVNTGSVNTNELANCHCNSSAAATSYAPTYVQMSATLDSTNGLNSFDDIVSYKERWQMRADWDKAGNCAYVYILDNVNSRVQKFNINGTLISTAGKFAGLNLDAGDFSTGIAVDKSGNVWVGDAFNTRVVKFDANGNQLAELDLTYANGGAVTGVALDSSNNIWVSREYDSVVQKFDKNFNFLLQIPCGGAAPSGCSSGTANGSFGGHTLGIAVDASDNLWVADMDNNRAEEFDKNGTYLHSITPGVNVKNVLVDSNGNIWLSEDHYVEEYNSNRTLINTYGAYGQGNALFTRASGAALDPSGNVWITDIYNNYVQKLSSGGVFQLQLGCAAPATSGCPGSSAVGLFNQPQGIAISR